MSLEPRIPMHPSELPRQRLVLVVDIPPKPPDLVIHAGYGGFREEVEPRQGVPRSPDLLAQLEWADSPFNCGINAYYLQSRKRYWVLWDRRFDDNWGRWEWAVRGYCRRRGVSREIAATHLLLEYWRVTADDWRPRPFHWVNEEGLLSAAQLRAMVRELEPEPDQA